MTVQIDRTKMKKVPKASTMDPFGLINYEDQASGRVVMAFIKNEMVREGSRMGIAIDGSGSMQDLFGRESKSVLIPSLPNHVKPAAQALSGYLAQRSADGKVAAIYWATGPGGKEIQILGDLTKSDAEAFDFRPPANYGTGTELLPALKYFTDGVQRKDLKDAAWGMYVFVTDGQLQDLDEVIKYCTTLAKDIEAGRRNDLKLILVGLGDQVDVKQFDILDNLETGTEVDLWYSTLAADLTDLSDIGIETNDQFMILVPSDGVVRDENGNTVASYRDTGLPAKLEFILPKDACKAFTLEVGGNKITQPLP